MTAKTATKIVVSPFDHVREIDGVDRIIRRTWTADVFAGETLINCGHASHATPAAAKACGRNRARNLLKGKH